MRGRLININDIKTFINGKRAYFTLLSKNTNNRLTYKLTLSKDKKVKFVRCLVNGAYQYMGYVPCDSFDLRWTRKSKVSKNDINFKALQWFLKHQDSDKVEFWHEGKCCCCGRSLTVPESIERGIGPVCGGKHTKEILEKTRVERMISSVDRHVAGDPLALNDLIDPGI